MKINAVNKIIDIILDIFENESDVNRYSMDIYLRKYMSANGIDGDPVYQASTKVGWVSYSLDEGPIYVGFSGKNLDIFDHIKYESNYNIDKTYKMELFKRFSRNEITEEFFLDKLYFSTCLFWTYYYENDLKAYIQNDSEFLERLVNIGGDSPEVINLKCYLYEMGLIKEKTPVYGTNLSKLRQVELISLGYDAKMYHLDKGKYNMNLFNVLRQLEYELFKKDIVEYVHVNAWYLFTNLNQIKVNIDKRRVEIGYKSMGSLFDSHLSYEYFKASYDVDKLLYLVLMVRYNIKCDKEDESGPSAAFVKEITKWTKGSTKEKLKLYKALLEKTNIIEFDNRDWKYMIDIIYYWIEDRR